MKKHALIATLFALSACTQAVDGTVRTSDEIKKSVHDSALKLKEVFLYHPTPKPVPRPMPESYCYRVMQDIVCYKDPQPGAEGRLVAYQGSVVEYPAEEAPAAVTQTVTTKILPPPKNGAPSEYVGAPPPVAGE